MYSKSSALKNVFLIGLVAVIISSASTYAFGLLSNKTVTTTGIIANASIGLYSDAAATRNVSSIGWGSCYPGSNRTYTIYIKNLGTVNETLSIQAVNWRPSIALNHLSMKSDYGGQTLAPNQVLKVALKLMVSPGVTKMTSFGFDILVTSQG